jgi:hypothetical protein
MAALPALVESVTRMAGRKPAGRPVLNVKVSAMPLRAGTREISYGRLDMGQSASVSRVA